jgi:hypothetical protein
MELQFNDRWDIKFCNYTVKFSDDGFDYINNKKIDN